MITIKNATAERTITAAEGGHVFAPGASVEVSETTLTALLSQPYIAGQITRGNLVVIRSEPELAAEGLTRSDVAKMRKAELVEVLEAHGMEAPEGTTDDLRAMAAQVVFLDA